MPGRRTIGPDISFRVAENIRRQRQLREWTTAELSRRMYDIGHEISAAVIGLIENGVYEKDSYRTRMVSVDEAKAFADCFSIPVSHLFRELPS